MIYDSNFSGVRLLATAQPSTFDYVTITDTGLMDPTVVLYAPAIHIDYNRHRLERLTITRGMADGIEIVRNDAYSNCKLSYSDITNNMGVYEFVRHIRIALSLLNFMRVELVLVTIIHFTTL